MKNGDVFGKWTVIEYVGPSIVRCRCICGQNRTLNACDLRSGKSTRCRSCSSKEPYSELGRRLRHISKVVLAKARGAAGNAIARCTDKTHSRYMDWGGRGIEVRFPNKDSFVEFLLTLPGCDNLLLVLDRIDNDKHYEIGNLRYVTRSDSQCNRRDRGGEYGYYVKYNFSQSFKRLHDAGMSFQSIGILYVANPSTVRNCVREMEESNEVRS